MQRYRPAQPALLVVTAVAVALLGVSLAPTEPSGSARLTAVGRVAPDELHVMSFNLLAANAESPASWDERRPIVRDLLRDERPHIIGTQEGLFEQLGDIQADLPAHYDSIGQGRGGGSHGQAMQIFYDGNRLEALEYDHYWLSYTPDVVGSRTWAGCCPRMVTWIRFLDTRTGTEFYVANTHLEHSNAETRERSARLMLARMDVEFDPDLPVIVTGDFNEPAGAGNAVFDLLVVKGPFVDAWEEAESRSALYGTFHLFDPLVPGGDRVDWVLTSPDVTTRVAFISTYEDQGIFPSDHLPVQAVVRLRS